MQTKSQQNDMYLLQIKNLEGTIAELEEHMSKVQK